MKSIKYLEQELIFMESHMAALRARLKDSTFNEMHVQYAQSLASLQIYYDAKSLLLKNLKKARDASVCDCAMCQESDKPCFSDCDPNSDTECTGCREREEMISEVKHEIDLQTGRSSH